MPKTIAFWWDCIKDAAFSGTADANNWQWVVANPLWQGIGAAIGAAIGGWLSHHWQGAPVLTPNTAAGVFLGGVAGFVITWIIAFLARLPIKVERKYRAEKDRADTLRADVIALSNELDRKHSPILRGELEGVIIGQNDDGRATCVANMSIRNIGAPSIADRFRLIAQKNGKTYQCIIIAIPQGITLNLNLAQRPSTIVLKQEDCIYEKTITPIPTGGQVRGWIFSVIDDIDRETLNTEGTIIEVKFADVLGKFHSSTHTFRKDESGSPPGWYLPGAGGQEKPRISGRIVIP